MAIIESKKLAELFARDQTFQARSLNGIAFMLLIAQPSRVFAERNVKMIGYSDRSLNLINRLIPLCPVLEDAILNLADCSYRDGTIGDGFEKETKDQLKRITGLEPVMEDAVLAIMTSVYVDGVESVQL